MKKMRCLVTGGAGFIGSHLADRLLELGHDVTVLDDFYRGKSPYQLELQKKVRFIEGSVINKELIDVNFQGTRNILDAAARSGSKVIFASTSEVYGKGIPPFSEESDRRK